LALDAGAPNSGAWDVETASATEARFPVDIDIEIVAEDLLDTNGRLKDSFGTLLRTGPTQTDMTMGRWELMSSRWELMSSW